MKKRAVFFLICLIAGCIATLFFTYRDYRERHLQVLVSSEQTAEGGFVDEKQASDQIEERQFECSGEDSMLCAQGGRDELDKWERNCTECGQCGQESDFAQSTQCCCGRSEEFWQGGQSAVYADGQGESGDLSKNIEELLDNFDDTALNELLTSLGQDERDLFGSLTFKEKLKAIINGDDGAEFSGVFSYLSSIFFGRVKSILPFILVILGICAVFSVVNSMKSGFSDASTANIIRFACVAIISVLLFAQIFSLINETAKTVNSMRAQINTVFPLILTFMSASGASGSVAAYTPAVAILANVLAGVITTIALPCFILAVVFDIVGNLSDAVKLKKMAGFFMSTLKWVLGTAFFVFLALLSVKGITASIRDSVSIRSAKYAISSYVPIIGGYLSEGFNMVMAGSVLIKNAVGLGGIVLLLLTVAPLIAGITVFSLSLQFLGAVTEPLDLGGISSIMSGIGKTLKSLTAIILGMTFLYFVFLLLTVCTGNMVL